jgi:hypothetical protein
LNLLDQKANSENGEGEVNFASWYLREVVHDGEIEPKLS